MDSAVCRSSTGCLEPATSGTFGTYFCAEHFAEVDLIRRTWFGADGAPLKRPRDPNEAPESLTEISERIREVVAAADPRPVSRAALRRTLRLPAEIQVAACTIGASRGRIVSTPSGFVLGDAEAPEDRALDLAAYVEAAGRPVTVREASRALGIAETAGHRLTRLALDAGLIEDRRRGGGAGGLVPAGGRQAAA